MKNTRKPVVLTAAELDEFRALLAARCEPPLVRPGVKPVTDEEYVAWEKWLMKRALLAESPAPPPRAYARLHSLLERLWEQCRDQALYIRGTLALAAQAKKNPEQEQLL